MNAYSDFFRRVCGNDPFPYQARFHEVRANLKILKIPTGLGKTDAAITDWLERRPTTRLIYCLPGRTLTRQTANIARERAKVADAEIQVLELMGGSEDLDSKLSPAQPAIIVGTQDILMSRALNRGYARTPFRWPMDFALLNNDAMWVYDEVQLLGDALATSTQLAAFRREFQTFGNVPSVWMSATFDESWLNTVDFKDSPIVIKLDEDDLQIEIVRKRFHATKEIKAADNCDTPKDCAQFVKEHHRDGTMTLVIANTVLRAQEIWDELRRTGRDDLYLLHSRFRPCDRLTIVEKALTGKRGIIVSTQVIEAGVDIDADLMVTDVAPWSSLVQRFGRVNRYGEKRGARIFWVDRPLRGKSKLNEEGIVRPYGLNEANEARANLHDLTSASSVDLPKIEQAAPYRFVLRRSDLLDLFDTTPDLAGNHIDVSRFVRSGEETNVYVAWRSWPEGQPPDRKRILQQELCPVPKTEEFDAFVKKNGCWEWNFAGRGKWERFDDHRRLYPGMRILLRSEAGGYDPEKGWAPAFTGAAPECCTGAVLPAGDKEEEAAESDSWTEGPRQTLCEHTDEVVAELEKMLAQLRLELTLYHDALTTAARYHDWGKAHPIFQETLYGTGPLHRPPDEVLAKSEGRKNGHSRKWFRHELASALAMIQEELPDLVVYIVAAHHGKVRVNIRSMPGEIDTTDVSRRIARGIEDGDTLWSANLGNGTKTAELTLELRPTELGKGADGFRGWSDRVLDLLSELGPFRLAYLEMLLRAADERASAKARGGNK